MIEIKKKGELIKCNHCIKAFYLPKCKVPEICPFCKKKMQPIFKQKKNFNKKDWIIFNKLRNDLPSSIEYRRKWYLKNRKRILAKRNKPKEKKRLKEYYRKYYLKNKNLNK